MFIDDTIAAIATAPGEGGIGIIRISGADSIAIASSIFKPFYKENLLDYPNRSLVYGNIVDSDRVIDEVLIARMEGPNSYTAEDVVEINCHGGFISVKKILELVLKKGARLADPGEFTKRAFLNGRIDLSQAEAVIDIINAKTDQSHDIAQTQLEGALSQKVRSLRNMITEVLAQVEVAIDYPEEDIEFITYKELTDKTSQIQKEVVKMYETSDTGKILREGLKTAILGKPNVGKSSLMNWILGENRAIVTEIAGTTRDVIEEFVNIKGIPLKIVDTAGIRETDDIVEKIGVEKSRDHMKSSDLVLVVLDSSRELEEDDLEILDAINPKKTLVLINKIDLESRLDMDKVKEYIAEENIIHISAMENKGLESIHDKIETMVYEGRVSNKGDVMITNTRHKDAIYKAMNSINDAIKGLEDHMSYDFIGVDLKDAWDSLGFINGDTVTEDLLDTIFKNFCIGK
ncbi:tRNA modification GTPase MnmE [Peptostreptococcus anaerobius]|uniref:tRNA modification GTPase MnmE n=1 Tax=Peptostreptococcus anaerobius TaxID=1261 RepID=A0A379CHC6_9FIRM|nr:tRNA uridine-5-carboxymethylaminomethyl(34) synthesis GTPase MnmE [Peptostreptococcus anaerobius]EKX95404.1 tRNA modification GTPase TrmE [Peptostreptococcus anaerobius VPI 4330 = DSM 2949]KXB73750.1 tRNA modification GTPase TrmE [Peptostreptococcus anaerobius]MDB8849625.1 tRNA uridine-5-carboxymethylaminomethyl(34) synthesis GTPase MnmE [Peptostreptococcus anaerobius]MDB8853428.1 tRNA uridine-5-carboxymethylaminomethyl(34) synthesis GTPase MnmE [Peptostreptococcus anaerobius]MDB8854927.1 t